MIVRTFLPASASSRMTSGHDYSILDATSAMPQTVSLSASTMNASCAKKVRTSAPSEVADGHGASPEDAFAQSRRRAGSPYVLLQPAAKCRECAALQNTHGGELQSRSS